MKKTIFLNPFLKIICEKMVRPYDIEDFKIRFLVSVSGVCDYIFADVYVSLALTGYIVDFA